MRSTSTVGGWISILRPLNSRKRDFFVCLRNGDIAGVVRVSGAAPEWLSDEGIGIRVGERNRTGAPRVEALHEVVDTQLDSSSRAEALGQQGITKGIVGYRRVGRRSSAPCGGCERDCRVTPQPPVAAQQLRVEAGHWRSTGIWSRTERQGV